MLVMAVLEFMKRALLITEPLRSHKYPPEGMEDAIATVMTQCELWADQPEPLNDPPEPEYEQAIPTAASPGEE